MTKRLHGSVQPRWFPSARLNVKLLEDRLTPATFTVNSLSDVTAMDTNLTLREAIVALYQGDTDGLTAAEISHITGNFGTNDTILFTGLTGTIAITGSAFPAIVSPVVIQGPGVASALTISGSSTFPIFDISPAANGDHFQLKNLTLSGGYAPSASGGALAIGDENVTITNCVISGNVALNGGGIAMSGLGSLTLDSTTVSGNSSTTTNSLYGGGGLFFKDAGNLTLNNSTISGNTAERLGGGILCYYGMGTFNISRSTLSGNTAKLGRGGAFYAFGAAGSFTLSNSTVSGNSARFYGGGLSFARLAGNLTIQNSTITANSTNLTSVGGGLGLGGGVAIDLGTGTVTITSSILAGNTNRGTSNTANDLYSTISPLCNNDAFTDSSGFTPATGSGSNLTTPVANLKLGSLAFNDGGTTQTHALLTGSAAINAGLNAAGLTVDQNGNPREQPAGSPDIGAYEVPPASITAQATFTTIDTASPYYNTGSYQFTVKYTAPIGGQIDTASLGPVDITFTGPGSYSKNASYVSFSDPNGDQSLIVATYILAANPLGTALWDAPDIGAYAATMLANEVKTTTGVSVPAGSLGNFSVVLPTTFIVTNTADSGFGSLRQALLNANANTPATDTVTFDPTLFTGTQKTITLASALPISDAVTINGPGSTLVAISGNQATRIIDATAAPLFAAIIINNVTLTGGSSASDGGAILTSRQKLSLTNSVVQNSTAVGRGGAISISNGLGQLFLTNSRISGNSSSSDGGGISFGSGTPVLTLVNATLNANTAQGNGGGVFFSSGGSVDVTTSAITRNLSKGSTGGGGLYFFGDIGAFDLRNTTISGNSATGNGGGILLQQPSGPFTIRNATLAFNTAASGGGLAERLNNGSASVSVVSSIVSGNSGGVNGDLDLPNPSLNLLVNLDASAVSDPDGYTANGSNAGNLSAANSAPGATGLKLGPLQVNALGTETHALGTGSSGIDTGSNPAGYTTDQRGLNRSNGLTDIGALEVQPAAPTVTGFTVNGSSAFIGVSRSRVLSLEVSFSGVVNPSDFSGLNAITLTRLASSVSSAGPVVATGVASGAVGRILVAAGSTSQSLLLTFDNANGQPVTPGVDSTSLTDGRWELAIPSASYNSTVSGVDPRMLRRLFADIQNDGTVNGVDLLNFGNVFGTNNIAFDSNNDFTINGADLIVLGNHFGQGF